MVILPAFRLLIAAFLAVGFVPRVPQFDDSDEFVTIQPPDALEVFLLGGSCQLSSSVM